MLRQGMAVSLGIFLLIGTTGTVWAADPTISSNASSVSVSAPILPVALNASTPESYTTAYQKALGYVEAHVSVHGRIKRSHGISSPANTSAYVAVALAENGHLATAEVIAQRLDQEQAIGGGWNQSLNPSATATLGASAHVLWALATVGTLSPASERATLVSAIIRGAQTLTTFASPVWGSFTAAVNAPAGPAEANAVAITALTLAGDVAGTKAEHLLWTTDAHRATAALLNDNGISRSTTTDFIAATLWNLQTNQVAAQREVGALFELGFAYQGYGAKAGPGYYTWMDWANGVSTFNDVIASVHADLPDMAEMQYNYGLTLQNPDGGFGTLAHPPVGPETGTFERGANASSVAVTARYLLATDSLLRHHMIGFGWKSAATAIGTQSQTVTAPTVASLDPTIPMQHGIRVAVLVSDPKTIISFSKPATPVSNEADLELNAAWQLTQMGYNVSLFWYKPNHAEDFYPRADLWANLDTFQVLVMSDNGFSDQNGYKQGFSKHASEFQTWLNHGGRFIDLGDQESAPLPASLAVTITPAAVNQVVWNGTTQRWDQAAAAYYQAPSVYQSLAEGKVGTRMQPVVVGARDGQGRVVLTTLSVARHTQDHMPVTTALWDWALKGVLPKAPPTPNYAVADRDLLSAMQTTYEASGTDLYIELYYPLENLPSPKGPQLMYSYLWPFTQAMAGITASASVLGPSAVSQALAAANQGLGQYYNVYLTPPGYESYVASGGGGTAYFDDNGWTDSDLIRAYQDTKNPTFLKEAEVDTTFLESGWNTSDPPAGGEYFNEDTQGRTQTATGSFLDAVLRLYLVTKNPKDLAWGMTISTWDRTYMRGLNGIYNDSMSPSGVVAGTPYTYDTGVALQADVLLYRATGNVLYLDRAEQLGVAAISAFVDPLDGVLVEDAGTSNAPFNAILLRGFDMLWETTHHPEWLIPLERQASLAIRYDRFSSGVYGSNWTGLNNPAVGVDLLTQGGTLRLFGMLATAQNQTK